MSCFYFSLLVVFCGMAAGLTREYTFIRMLKSWTDAQLYCKLNYTGLAVITSDEENQRLKDAGQNFGVGGWIGMYRSQENKDIWLLEDGSQSSFFAWRIGEPYNFNGHEDCVYISALGWNDMVCESQLPFYCYKILVLVKEKKTWEEALDYCRKHYTGLASPASETQLKLAEMESNKTETDSVWIGLRFLNGRWVWVSKEPLRTLVSLPSCPHPDLRCGAVNTKKHIWENRDCSEKLNFLCYD